MREADDCRFIFPTWLAKEMRRQGIWNDNAHVEQQPTPTTGLVIPTEKITAKQALERWPKKK